MAEPTTEPVQVSTVVGGDYDGTIFVGVFILSLPPGQVTLRKC